MPTLDEIIADKKTYPDEQSITLAEGTEVTLGQLRAGYMKDADYRRKTSDIARQREDFDRDRTSREQALQDAEAKLMQLAQQVVHREPDLTRDEVAEYIERDPIAQRLMGKIAELEKTIKPLAEAVVGIDDRMKQSSMQYMAEQHRRVLAWLKDKDPDLDADGLVKFAQENYIPRLDMAYKLYRYEDQVKSEREKARQEGEKKGREETKKELVSPMLPLRRTVATKPEGAPKTFDEAISRASKDMDVMGPLMGVEPGA